MERQDVGRCGIVVLILEGLIINNEDPLRTLVGGAARKEVSKGSQKAGAYKSHACQRQK